ncbi:transcriptional regulator [uncultured Williamsia sp.]|uniref:transcriptional regulator n=1 Tax=uncultured Williamsia sp. TaxID=259311 RepID=UPI00261E306F|nr:transcriptional regulator [uncultured Williamsia sp.]
MSSPHRRRHRPALIVLVAVAFVACLGLAWWQWTRFESTDGTGQNLGYALQWPAFAAFVVYAYRRFVVLESDPEEVAKLDPATRGATEIRPDVLPPRPAPRSAADDVLDDGASPEDRAHAEYNRYLSDLARRDAR